MPDPLHEKTAAELGAALESGDTSAMEVAQAYLARTQAVDDKVRAFLHFDEEDFLAQAAASDERRAKGQSNGPLDWAM